MFSFLVRNCFINLININLPKNIKSNIIIKDLFCERPKLTINIYIFVSELFDECFFLLCFLYDISIIVARWSWVWFLGGLVWSGTFLFRVCCSGAWTVELISSPVPSLLSRHCHGFFLQNISCIVRKNAENVSEWMITI